MTPGDEGHCPTCNTSLPAMRPAGGGCGLAPNEAWAQAWFRLLRADEEPAELELTEPVGPSREPVPA